MLQNFWISSLGKNVSWKYRVFENISAHKKGRRKSRICAFEKFNFFQQLKIKFPLNLCFCDILAITRATKKWHVFRCEQNILVVLDFFITNIFPITAKKFEFKLNGKWNGKSARSVSSWCLKREYSKKFSLGQVKLIVC